MGLCADCKVAKSNSVVFLPFSLLLLATACLYAILAVTVTTQSLACYIAHNVHPSCLSFVVYFKPFTFNIVRPWFGCTPGNSAYLLNKCYHTPLLLNTSFVLCHSTDRYSASPRETSVNLSFLANKMILMCPPSSAL